jgi:hypothetical protein
MMEAARTSETSVDNYFTRQYIPEDNSELHTRRRENLKSHIARNNFIDFKPRVIGVQKFILIICCLANLATLSGMQ